MWPARGHPEWGFPRHGTDANAHHVTLHYATSRPLLLVGLHFEAEVDMWAALVYPRGTNHVHVRMHKRRDGLKRDASATLYYHTGVVGFQASRNAACVLRREVIQHDNIGTGSWCQDRATNERV